MSPLKAIHKIEEFCYNRPMPAVVDLNCDMGESFGIYTVGNDSKVIGSITSANVACGFHASDPVVMARTVALCKENNVMVGAHPGYPDLPGFGRRHLDMAAEELVDSIIYQVGALKGFTDYHGLPLQHVKLHGALYNLMVREESTFLRIVEALRKTFGDMIFLTLGTGKSKELKTRCRQEGIMIALEAFPDRAYTDDGELLPRKYKEAVFHDPEIIAQRATKMVKEGGIKSVNGRWVEMDMDTLCVHGDNNESIEAVRLIREYAAKDAISVKPLAEFLG
jgi:5-oxoprolinase (ATP-hydrolysing) subunit A